MDVKVKMFVAAFFSMSAQGAHKVTHKVGWAEHRPLLCRGGKFRRPFFSTCAQGGAQGQGSAFAHKVLGPPRRTRCEKSPPGTSPHKARTRC